MRKNKFLLWIGCLVTLHIAAQEPLTLEQAIETVLKNNYDIQLAQNEAEIAQRNNTIGNAGMLPRVNAGVSDNFTLNHINQKYTNGTEINQSKVDGNAVNAGVALNWTLFDGLKMFATKGKLKRLEEIGALQLKDEMQQVVANVVVAYYNVVAARQQLNAINDAIKISEERVKLADMKFQVGTSSKVDLLQAKVDLNEQKSNALTQQKAIAQRKAELNNLLARNADTPFEVTDSIPLTYQPPAADLENKNFRLLLAGKNVEVAKFEKKEAFSQFLPNLVGNLGYNYARSQSSAGFSLYNQSYGMNAGFTLNIPLFNGLNTIRENKVAAIRLQSAQFNLEKARFETNLSYYNALKDFENATQALELENENIGLADENQQIALERFRLGQSTAIELREAQKSYTDALSRLVNARFAAKSAEAELMRLNGDLIK